MSRLEKLVFISAGIVWAAVTVYVVFLATN